MSTLTVRTLGISILLTMSAFCYGAPRDLGGDSKGAGLEVTTSRNSDTIPLHEVFEITFKHDREYENPFFDVAVEVVFLSPSGRRIQVGGFHYGSSSPVRITKQKIRTNRGGERLKVEYHFDKRNLWKARFAPSETETWKYEYVFRNKRGQTASGGGSFLCVEGRKPSAGFVRVHPTNPYRLVFDDGGPFFPIGLQDGVFDNSGTGSALDQWAMEGPFRTDLKDPPPLPSGPEFVRGPSTNPHNADVYFRTFSQCGFNLYRFSQQNFSLPLYEDLDRYLVQEGVMVDELLRCARKYDFRIFYGIFGYKKVSNFEPDDGEEMAKVKRFIAYSVNRWGAYVDFWEFLNEQKADDRWYALMTPYLRSIDPYDHPIATSWERPELDGIEVNAPHWYQRENELESDRVTASRAKNWKRHGKPVVVGEQGNRVDRQKPRPPGVGGVWDDRSALRMRIRNWTAFFHEIAFVFWNTSYARDGHNMNIWLGPKEREYVRAMQDFAYRLDRDIRIVPIEVSVPEAVRAYGLASSERAGVYLHHFRNHVEPVKDLKITLDVPKDSKGYWYSPENAAILEVVVAPAGRRSFEAPDFTVDLAFLVTPDGPPDIDLDGTPNHRDPDDDNDGVPDAKDPFPLDPSEWKDADRDLIGDRFDADDDGDGRGDDANKNGVPDRDEFDFDGDGFDRCKSVPWDAFPWNPKEWRDTDGDGQGDNLDRDDDGDGWSDGEEKKRGTNPLDKLSFPRNN